MVTCNSTVIRTIPKTVFLTLYFRPSYFLNYTKSVCTMTVHFFAYLTVTVPGETVNALVLYKKLRTLFNCKWNRGWPVDGVNPSDAVNLTRNSVIVCS